MSYLCGWCGKYLDTKTAHSEHLEKNTNCLKRDGPISPLGYDRIQRIIKDIDLIGLDEKLDPDNELMLSEARSALQQIHK